MPEYIFNKPTPRYSCYKCRSTWFYSQKKLTKHINRYHRRNRNRNRNNYDPSKVKLAKPTGITPVYKIKLAKPTGITPVYNKTKADYELERLKREKHREHREMLRDR